MAEVRILIAEENSLVAQTLKEQLSSLGYAVAGIARSGGEAVRLCEELRPDLVIMDLHLPELGGYAAARQIGQRVPTPIVMMATFANGDSPDVVDEIGVLAYLVKPVNPEELPPAIDIALARHRELEQLRTRVEDLHDTLESHKLFERAKGILMKRFNISGAEAEARIQQRATERQSSVKEIAQAIVDSDALLS